MPLNSYFFLYPVGHFGLAADIFLVDLPFAHVIVFFAEGRGDFDGLVTTVGAGCPFEIVTLIGSEAKRPETTRSFDEPFIASAETLNVVVDSKFGATE